MIHGDASVGNVIRDASGQAVLIDLDGFAIGPREWDLVLTAMYYDGFGWHAQAEYEQFVEVYGFDVMKWPGYWCSRVRQFLMVTWLSQKGADDERAAAEVRKRIASLRSGGSNETGCRFSDSAGRAVSGDLPDRVAGGLVVELADRGG